MSAEMRVVGGEEAVGGMIARLEGMKEEVAEEDGETTALLQDVAPLQGEARHREVVPLQDVEVLLHRDRVCSWHRGQLEVQAEVVEVAGENVKSRRRNLGALEAETTVLQDVTLLQGGVARPQDEVLPQEEAHLQEEVHLQGEEALLAGMKGEVMQEVGDVAVVVEALLQGEDLHQEGVLLQGVAHLQGGVRNSLNLILFYLCVLRKIQYCLEFYIQGVFFNWYPPKNHKYGKKLKYQNWYPPSNSQSIS